MTLIRKKWGCWFNRDVEGIVRRALSADSANDVDVDVESVQRWHFGTTVVIEARPRERKDERNHRQQQ